MRPGLHYVGVTTPFYCNDGKGNFLFHKRSVQCRDEHGSWDPGGGKLEFGQTPEENVLREVMEEYGCAGKIQEQIPAHSVIREWEGKKTHWIAMPFFIEVNREEVKNNEPDKIDEIGWFTLTNLPDPLHTGFQHALKEYECHFKKYHY